MNRSIILILSTVFLFACDDKDKDGFECPTVIEPVIVSAVRVNLFNLANEPLNVCDAILTVDFSEYSETIYGSAFDNCEERNSLEGGNNLVEHHLLIEKAGYINQTFEGLLPLETECSYKTLEIDVYLEPN